MAATYRDVACYALDAVLAPNTSNTPQPLHWPCVLPVSAFYHCPSAKTAESCVRAAARHVSRSAAFFRADDEIEQASSGFDEYSLLTGGVKKWVRTSAFVVRVLNPTLIALAIIGNVLVASVIMQRRLRSSCNSFQISACLAAIFYAVSLLLMRLGDYVDSYEDFVLYRDGKEYIHHAHYALFLVYLWSHVGAAFERRRSGFKTDEAKSGCRTIFADLWVLLIWLAAGGAAFGTLWFAYLGTVVNKNSQPETELACPLLYWGQSLIAVLLPTILVFIGIFVACSGLRRQLQAVGKITLGTSGELWRQRLQEEIQWSKLVIVQLVLLFLLVLPYALVQFVRINGVFPDATEAWDVQVFVPGVCFWATIVDLLQLGVLFYASLQFVIFGCLLEKFAVTFRSLCCGCICPGPDESVGGGY